MLAVPKAFRDTGIALALGLLGMATIVSYQSIICLVYCSSKTKLETYSELAYYCYGSAFKIFVDLIFFLNNFGTAVSASILVDIFFNEVQENIVTTSRFIRDIFWKDMPSMLTDETNPFWIVLTQGLLILLVVKTELTNLRFFSLISFLVIIYVAGLIVFYSFLPSTNDFENNSKLIEIANFKGVNYALPIFIFGFTCQQNVLTCYRELNCPTPRRMKKAIVRQIFLAFSIYLFVGIYGYFTFPMSDESSQNLLTRYNPKDHIPMLIAMGLMTVSMFVVQPFNISPTKECLYQMVKPGKTMSYTSHLALSLVVHVSQAAIAALAVYKGIGMNDALGYLSGSTSAIMCFIFPFTFFLRIFEKADTRLGKIKRAYYLLLNSAFIIFQVYLILCFFPFFKKWLGMDN